MKYIHYPEPTTSRDFAHPESERPASFGRVIGGLCTLVGGLFWALAILHLEVIAR